MNSNYKINPDKKWDYENGFYLTSGPGRIGKFINHLEIYKTIINLPGDILEFGVYKGSSIMRLFAFRELLETSLSRKIIGFDVFGKFPSQLNLDSDIEFVRKFENQGGNGISKKDLEIHIQSSGYDNFELVKGDINKTLPEWLTANPQKRFSLIHIDVDVYEPTMTILKHTYDKLVPGGVLMLDDWGTVEGETRAVEDFFGSNIKIQKHSHYHIPAFIIKE